MGFAAARMVLEAGGHGVIIGNRPAPTEAARKALAAPAADLSSARVCLPSGKAGRVTGAVRGVDGGVMAGRNGQASRSR
jgi:hypothetical protein